MLGTHSHKKKRKKTAKNKIKIKIETPIIPPKKYTSSGNRVFDVLRDTRVKTRALEIYKTKFEILYDIFKHCFRFVERD
jgi:hypothetical protein